MAAQEVQNKVNLIVPHLPQTAKQPVVQKFDPDAAPIMQIAVSAPRSLRDVTLIADKQIKQKLENAKGVGQITHRRRRARARSTCMVDPDRLRAYNLTITDVFNALRAQNLELPGGNLNAGREGVHRPHHRPRRRTPRSSTRSPSPTATATSSRSRDIGYAEDSYEEPRTRRAPRRRPRRHAGRRQAVAARTPWPPPTKSSSG